MELVNILIIASAVVLIFVLWVIVGYRHLKHLKSVIHGQWELLDEGLRKRHNLIPNLIETIRIYVTDQEPVIERFIKERTLAAREYFPDANKIEYEFDLSKTIDAMIDLGRSHQELGTDTNFLELRKEIDDLEINIEAKSKKYNKMVRDYNKHRTSVLLIPLSSVFGFKLENIFEVEI